MKKNIFTLLGTEISRRVNSINFTEKTFNYVTLTFIVGALAIAKYNGIDLGK